MEDRDERVISVDQLPDDPLQMPPPYWRGGSAIFHLEQALLELEQLLVELVPVHARTEARLEKHWEKYPDGDDAEEALEEFGEITHDLTDLEHRIKLKAELACLMSAIETEAKLNQFCVFNLHKDIAEPIEKLSPPEKLLVAAAVVGSSGVKTTSVFEAVRRLSTWRNAFAHGHCVDRPTKSLRHNHLISPGEYPGVPSAVAETRDLVGAFLRVSDYLRDVSMNSYTRCRSSNVEEIRESLERVSRYHFDGNNYVYDVTLSKAALRKVAAAIKTLVATADEDTASRVENMLATLDVVKRRLLRLELGLDDGNACSPDEAAEIVGLDARDAAKERAIALTRFGDVVDFLRDRAV